LVVDHLTAVYKNNKNIGVACIYLNHMEIGNQTPSKLLAALWRQLVVDRDIGSDVEDLYMKHYKRGTSPSLQEVAGILSSSLGEFSQVFIVIDAIDEYPENQRFMLLGHLVDQISTKHHINLMVTARPHVSANTTPLPNIQTLEIRAMPKDIQRFINLRIDSDSSSRLFRHVQKQPGLRADIHSRINCKSVDGM
jgi:hypothetical protein